MGVYAQTNYEISCKNNKTAKKVKEIIENLTKNDKDFNNFGSNLEIDGDMIYAFMDSGRIQNLEWRCEQIWNAIKDLEVVEFNCPFLSEADGYYQSKDNE